MPCFNPLALVSSPAGSRSELYLPPDRTGCSPISDQGVLVCLAWFDGGYSSHPAPRPRFLSFATFNISSSATGGPRCAQPHQPSVASTLFFIKMSLRILDADVDASMACMACIRSAWTKASDNATSPPVIDCRSDNPSSFRCNMCRNRHSTGCFTVCLFFSFAGFS